MGDANYPHDNIYPGGAVLTPEGKVAIMYAAQKFPDWTGFGLATADQPLGPFDHYETTQSISTLAMPTNLIW